MGPSTWPRLFRLTPSRILGAGPGSPAAQAVPGSGGPPQPGKHAPVQPAEAPLPARPSQIPRWRTPLPSSPVLRGLAASAQREDQQAQMDGGKGVPAAHIAAHEQNGADARAATPVPPIPTAGLDTSSTFGQRRGGVSTPEWWTAARGGGTERRRTAAARNGAGWQCGASENGGGVDDGGDERRRRKIGQHLPCVRVLRPSSSIWRGTGRGRGVRAFILFGALVTVRTTTHD